MFLRPYETKDCPSMIDLFRNTVYSVNAKDYTRDQLDVWTEGVNAADWNRSFLNRYSLVAVENGMIAGFGDIDLPTGYLDRLYVHKDFQSKGVATALCDALESAVNGRVFVHSSITAKPFFEKRGYKTVKKQSVERKGLFLTNYVMEKNTGNV